MIKYSPLSPQTLSDAARRMHGVARARPNGAPPLGMAVLISGGMNHANVSFFEPNPVLMLSPMQLYLRLKHTMPSPWAAHLFLCGDQSESMHPALERAGFSGAWSFKAADQFERMLICLTRVEQNHAGVHDAYLRVRPDMLMLGPMPLISLAENPRTLLVKWNRYNPSFLRQGVMRDELICGMCDQWCECAQRKYGQVLYHFSNRSNVLGTDGSRAPGNCGFMTDTIFGFGRELVPTVLKVLHFYSGVFKNVSAWPRSPKHQPDHCVEAGVMVEIGLHRLFDLENVTYVPLRLRTILARTMQPDMPSWQSVACMLTWGADPVPCSAPCVMPRSNSSAEPWREHKSWAPKLPPHCPMTYKGQNAGCNPVNKGAEGHCASTDYRAWGNEFFFMETTSSSSQQDETGTTRGATERRTASASREHTLKTR
jgi:hypothetical protein